MPRMIVLCLTALILSACQAESGAPASDRGRETHPSATDRGVIAHPVWRAEVDRYLSVNIIPSDPLEGVMWRGVRCDFLRQQIGERNDAQARAISARMAELACGNELRAEARALRDTHGGEAETAARLDALLAQG